MALNLEYLINTVRTLASQYNAAGRFPDSVLISNINLAQRQVMLAVEFPEKTYWFQADGTSYMFALPEEGITSMLRVYINGQPCAPSTQDILEGLPYGIYGGGNGPSYQPEWRQVPFSGFPAASRASQPSSAMSVPYFIGQQPSYFLKGETTLVVLPFPQKGSLISYDCYPALRDLVNYRDQTLFPLHFAEIIAMRALMYCFFEQGPAASGQLQMATEGYKEQKIVIKQWRDKLVRDIPTPVILHNPSRSYWVGPYRGPTSIGRMGGN